MFSPPVACPALVGRDDELALINRAFGDLRRGKGTALHLVGEAGIGKTELLHGAERSASEFTFAMVATACDSDQRRRLACVRQLLPDIPADTPDSVGVTLGVIDELVRAGPVVLIADDVQWADGASLEVLGSIVRRAEDSGVFVLTAARTRPSPPELLRFESTVYRFGHLVRLSRLSTDCVADLVQATYGASPDDELLAALSGTSGNPFLTVELLRALDADRSLDCADGVLRLANDTGLPRSLSERLARDAVAASDSDSLLIRAAAVLTGGFTTEELADITERPLIGVLGDLLRLAETEVLREHGHRLVFRHDIIRQAVIHATPLALMRSLNRRAITVLGDRNADPERIASCWLAAADPESADDLAALIEVGRQLHRTSPFAAADVLTLVCDTLDHADPRFVEVCLLLGWTLVDLGRISQAQELLDSLADVEPDRLDVRHLRGEVANLRGELMAEFAPLVNDFDLDAAFAVVDEVALGIVAELALFELLCGRLGTARKYVEWIESRGMPIGPAAEVLICEVRAVLHGRSGCYEAGLVETERGLDVAALHPSNETARARPIGLAATMLDNLGRSDEALRLLRAGDTEAGPQWIGPMLQTTAALTLYRRGEWDDALAEVSAGIAATDELGVHLAMAWAHAIAALIQSARGESSEAKGWLQRADEEIRPGAIGMEWLIYARAMVVAGDGDWEAALALLRPVVEIALAVDAPAVLINLSPDTARLACRKGDTKTACAVGDNLEELARRTQSPVVEAYRGWVSGLMSTKAEQAERAADLFVGCGRNTDRVRALHDAAVIFASNGSLDDARRVATTAFGIYDEIGAQHLHSRLRSELRTQGLTMRPRRTAPRPASGWESLTPSERRVVSLIGDGCTNGDIASQLFVSRRTVESHLARVYPKLGFPTRAALLVAELNRRQESIGD